MKKHTKGKCELTHPRANLLENTDSFAIGYPLQPHTSVHVIDGNIEEALANAQLICEAFNVTNETNLTPLELKEQNEKMREALEYCNRFFKDNHGSMPVFLRPVRDKVTESLTPSKGQN